MTVNKSLPMMAPRYVSEFHCVGADCPDTCCANWTIPIDKATFSQYRRVVHPALKPIFKSHLVQDKQQLNSFALHSQLKLRQSDGHCPMHSASGLCSVQLHLGEALLSDTCFTYPRTVVQIGDRIEQCLTLSCPEAARLALTRSDAFDFVETDMPFRVSAATSMRAVLGFSIEAMDAVRTFAIQLLQTQGLTNIESLAALGWLCHQIDALASSSIQNNLPTLLAEMTKMVESGALPAVVRQLEEQPTIGVAIFYILFKKQHGVTRPEQQQRILTQVSEGLGINTDSATDLTEIETAYRHGLSLLNEDRKGFEWAMNRYLLNDLIRETFPWGQSSAMLHYRRLLTRFGILRLMLSGVASSTGKMLDQDTIVRTVQVFCRLYQHNDAFAKNAELCLKDLDWNSLERLYTLLK